MSSFADSAVLSGAVQLPDLITSVVLLLLIRALTQPEQKQILKSQIKAIKLIDANIAQNTKEDTGATEFSPKIEPTRKDSVLHNCE